MKRYPDLGFLIQFLPEEGKMHAQETVVLPSLDEVEIVYVWGLRMEYFQPLEQWVKGKAGRALIFIENDLAVIKGTEFVDEPRAHLRHQVDMEELAEEFPTGKVALLGPFPKEKKEELLRLSAARGALYSDVIYSHKIVKNVLANWKHLEKAANTNMWKGAFEGVPAIICGAGPSLEKSLPWLKKNRDKALIIAGGTAGPYLSKKGILPHLMMALDPNLEELKRFSEGGPFTSPLLFAPRLHPDVFAHCTGPLAFMHTATGGAIEEYLLEKMGMEQKPIGPDLGAQAFSVTTLAVSMAVAFGCQPIVFTGLDLAYTGGRRYPEGVEGEKPAPGAFDAEVEKTDIHGNPILTAIKWVMESEAISAFARAQKGTQFFNATGGGLGFEGIPNHSLEELELNGPSFSVEQWLKKTPCPQFDLSAVFSELTRSLEKCAQIAKEAAEGWQAAGEGKKTLWEMLIKEEPAYRAFLEGIDHALVRLLPRFHVEDPAFIPVAHWRELERNALIFLELIPQGAHANP